MQVKNAGNARVPGAALYIRWPYETAAGQHVLYLLDLPTIVSYVCGIMLLLLPVMVMMMKLTCTARLLYFIEVFASFVVWYRSMSNELSWFTVITVYDE